MEEKKKINISRNCNKNKNVQVYLQRQIMCNTTVPCNVIEQWLLCMAQVYEETSVAPLYMHTTNGKRKLQPKTRIVVELCIQIVWLAVQKRMGAWTRFMLG